MATESFRKEGSAALVISVFMFGSFLLSFFLQSLLASTYGASTALDAFTVSNSLPFLFVNWIAYAAVSVILVPVFTEARLSRSGEAETAANGFMSFLFIVSLLAAALCSAAATPIIAVIGRGFDEETRALAVDLLRMLMPVFPIGVLCGILSGLLRAHDRYAVTPIARCFELLPVIVIILALGNRLSIYALPIGMVSGAVISLGIHIRFSTGTGLRFRYGLARGNPKVRAMVGTFFLFGVFCVSQHLIFLVDRLVASFLMPGSVALYHFASRFQILVVMILPVAISIPFYSRLNRHLQAGDTAGVRETIYSGLRLVAVTVIPLFTLLVALRVPVIELWLEHGAFSARDTQVVARLFLCLAPAILVEAVAPIAFHIYFSVGERKALNVLLWMAVTAVVANTILDFTLVRVLGLRGVALATSLVTLPTNAVSWIYISRHMGGLRLRSLSPYLLKVVFASVCMVPVVVGVDAFLGETAGSTTPDRALRLGVLVASGGLVYLLLCLLLGVREIREIAGTIKGKLLSLR